MTDELQKAYEGRDAYVDLDEQNRMLVDLGSWRNKNMLLVRSGGDVFAIEPTIHGIIVWLWEDGKLSIHPRGSEEVRLFGMSYDDEQAIIQRKRHEDS